MTSITALNVRLGMDAANFAQGAELARSEVNKITSLMRRSVPPAEQYQKQIDLLNKAFSDQGRQTKEYADAVQYLTKRYSDNSAEAARLEAQRKQQAAEEQRINNLTREGEALTRSLFTAEQKHAAEVRRLNELYKTQSIGLGTYNKAMSQANAALRSASPAEQRHNQLMTEGRQITQSMLSPLEQHANRLSRLKELYRAGAIDATTYQQAIRKADQQLKVHSSTADAATANTGRLMASVKSLAAAYVGFHGIRAGLKIASDFELAGIAFETMTGSAKEGRWVLEDLTQFAAATPITLTGAQDAARTLLTFGMANEKVMPTIRMLGDVSGGSQERMQSLALAFGQMSASGRLMGQDLLQMINAGFNPLQEISRTTGQSIGELKKQMESGAISIDMVTAAFESATGPGGRFHGMMERMGDTATGAYNQLVSSVQEVVAVTGGHLLPVLARSAKSIESVVRSTSGLVTGMDKSQAQVLATVGAFSTAVVVIPKVAQAIAAITSATKMMTKAQVVSLAFAGPKGWATIAAGAAAAAIAVRQVGKAYDEMAENAKKASDKAGAGEAADQAKSAASAMAVQVTPLENEFLKLEQSLNEQVKLLNLGEDAYRRQQLYAKGMSIAQVQRIDQLHREIELAEEMNRKKKEREEKAKSEVERLKKQAEDAFSKNIASALQAARQVFEDRKKADAQMRADVSAGPGAGMEVGSAGAAKYMADQVNAAIGAATVPDRPSPGERELLRQAQIEFAAIQEQVREQRKNNELSRRLIAAVEENAVRRAR